MSAREGHTEPWQGGIGKLGLGQIGRTGLEREWPDDGMRRSGVQLDCASWSIFRKASLTTPYSTRPSDPAIGLKVSFAPALAAQ